MQKVQEVSTRVRVRISQVCKTRFFREKQQDSPEQNVN